MSIISAPGFKNVCILSISSALGGSIITLMVLAGSLVGAELAPSTSWATAPIAIMILGTAITVIPVTQCMRILGRKNTLLLDLLAKKSNEINHISHDLRHTDDIIYDLAFNHQLAVLTVDKNLKRRLFTSGIDVVEVVKNNHLNLIEGL